MTRPKKKLRPSAYLPLALRYFGKESLMEHPKTPMVRHLADKVYTTRADIITPEACMAAVFMLSGPQFYSMRPTATDMQRAFGISRKAFQDAQDILAIPVLTTFNRWSKKYKYRVSK